MKCPLMKRFFQSETGKWHTEIMDCGKEECAWWLEDVNLCAIKDLALELRYTQLRLADMNDKMSPARE